MKAIDTIYKGCKFRSRLEARWAVFFDDLGIAWDYEPQGFRVTHRITAPWNEENDADRFQYLPDFWLPEQQVWVEVKGALDQHSTLRLIDAAASLSSNDGGGCHDSGGHDLVVCGRLTNSILPGLPTWLHMHKGDLEATCFFCGPHHWGHGTTVACDTGEIMQDAGEKLLNGTFCTKHSPIYNLEIDAALTRARRARFEHGAAA